MRARSTATEAMETELRADLGLGADALGDGEGALEERLEGGGDGADFAGDGVGVFDLAEDLRLADDHGVERGGDAEEMADGFALAELVEVGLDGVGGDGEVLVQEAQQAGVGGAVACVLPGDELDAIAGGEDEGFADAGLMGQGADGVGQAGGGDGEALADLERRGGVIDADQDERALAGARSGAASEAGLRSSIAGALAHGVENLWTAENWLAAQTKRTTRMTKLER